MIFKVFLVIVLLIFPFSNKLEAMSLTETKTKYYKDKMKLVINGKTKEKKVQVNERHIYALGSKGLEGIKAKKGGYCHKFINKSISYKNKQIARYVYVIKNFEKCFTSIESYNNAEDNILDEYYMFTTLYGTDEVRVATEFDMLSKGVAGILYKSHSKLKFLMGPDNDGNQIIYNFYPTVLNDENNYVINKFFDENDHLFDLEIGAAMKKIIPKFLDWSLVDIVSFLMQEEKETYRNQKYIYSCDTHIFSATGSFSQQDPGFVTSKKTIEKLNFIEKQLSKFFTSFRYDENLKKKDFANLISEVFNSCEGTGFTQILRQNRN